MRMRLTVGDHTATAALLENKTAHDFASLLPLTLAVAGLPEVEAGRHLNEGQLEVRGTIIRNAYKIAKKVLRDVAAGG